MGIIATILASSEFMEICLIALGISSLAITTKVITSLNELLGNVMVCSGSALLGCCVLTKLLSLIKYLTIIFCLF